MAAKVSDKFQLSIRLVISWRRLLKACSGVNPDRATSFTKYWARILVDRRNALPDLIVTQSFNSPNTAADQQKNQQDEYQRFACPFF